MDELLDTLASNGYTLCVATSKPRVFAERILDHFGIAVISPSSAAQDWTARCRRRPM